MTAELSGAGRIGRYHLVKRLAVGGMADIWLAQEFGVRGYERTVVVKTIRADLVEDEELIAMMVEEARIARCLLHENIVELYEVGEEAGTHYLAMEFVFGRDCRQLRDRCIERGLTVPVRHVAAIVSSVLDALHYAYHDARFEGRPLRVIHRDVSPQNIVVGFDGTVKLLDFGIAKAAAQLSRTRAGVLKGKYAYMSPEQVAFRDLDQRADVFGVGIVLWEMLTGERLFYRLTEYETIQAVTACEVASPRLIRPDVPRQLGWICGRALRRNPRWRYKDAMHMKRALSRWDERDPATMRQELADWMRQLFSDELESRARALTRARRDPERHRQMRDAGLELIDGALRRDVSPARPPLANVALGEPQTQSATARTRVDGLVMRALANARAYRVTFGILVVLGVALGAYFGTRLQQRFVKYATLSIVADVPNVDITIGDRRVGRAPVRDVLVQPGRHRITGSVKGEEKIIEITVEAGQRRVVHLTTKSD